MTSASFEGSGVKACPIAGQCQGWESYEEDLQAWSLSTELVAKAIGPHVKSRGFSANLNFRQQAKCEDMARLSSNPADHAQATGALGFNYLLEFMQQENRTKDDVAKILRFCSWPGCKRNNRRIEECVTESLTLMNEFEQDRFVNLDGFVKSLLLATNAELDQQQLSNLSTRLDIDGTLTVEKTKAAIQKVLGENLQARQTPHGGCAAENLPLPNESWSSSEDAIWEDHSWTEGWTEDSNYGQTGCLRCGDPNHWVSQCPHPPPLKGKPTGKGKDKTGKGRTSSGKAKKQRQKRQRQKQGKERQG